MLDITILAVGKIKDKNLFSFSVEYLKRLKPFVKIKVVEISPVAFSDNTKEAAKKFEGEKIIEILKKEETKAKGAAAYLLAERGLSFKSSPDFAFWLAKKSPLVLVVGGALGFSDELYKSYPQVSLSPLTFPHELARVIVFEQIYRASTVLNGKEYHY
jgi:23S rRNA (pseudouridine1915-N3)-methyltransferase